MLSGLLHRPASTRVSRRSSSFRPALDSLEGRVVTDAKMAGVLVGPVADHAVSRPVPVEVAPMSMTSHAAFSIVKQADQNGWYQYTAISITNRSTATINFSLEWGNGPWKSYTLKPGYQQLYYIGALNQTATISFDKSFAAGFQEQRYKLTGNNASFPPGLYLTTPIPSFSQGRAYTFQNVSGGVQLYS
jgi:hypothetical protein